VPAASARRYAIVHAAAARPGPGDGCIGAVGERMVVGRQAGQGDDHVERLAVSRADLRLLAGGSTTRKE